MNPVAEAAGPTVFDHLLELRSRLLRAVAGVLLVFVALLPFANRLYAWLARPLLEKLPAGGQANPMVYEHGGRQYVVIMAGGHHFMETPAGDYVMAYALPR